MPQAQQSAADLAARFHLPGLIRWEAGQGGLPCARITAPGGEATVYPHGAHVTAWTPAGHGPVLWMSAKSRFDHGQPIRGGVPICFPWFGPHPSDPDAPAHGPARLREWQVVSAAERDGDVELGLVTEIFPFACDVRVRIGETLTISMGVRHLGDTASGYTQALHTYLAVGDAKQVEITGLNGVEYLDKMDTQHDAQPRRKTQGDQPIRFEGETDRVYVGTESTVTLHDPAMNRRIAIQKSGSRSTVVWNPWTDKAARMEDFGDDEWPGMCCIETANAADDAVTLEPGQERRMEMRVRVERA